MGTQVIVVGLGEVGRPLFELLRKHHQATGIDIEPVDHAPSGAIMHLCFPFGPKFVVEAARYVKKYRPELTIINSTVAPGTTRQVAAETGNEVVNSPVRGKHAKMQQDMLHYTKFVGALNAAAGEKACAHFASIGMKTKLLMPAEASELAKLTETTYFGLLIAWAQEVERYCKKYNVDYESVISFYEEIPFFPPVKYFPGVIGGHCVMPNIKILKQCLRSGVLDMIEKSNELKTEGKGIEGW
jgi:UDP-N-acetyl-D-mannosaminuronate dehydrogenase